MSGSDSWVVQNLENALETWNDKLGEIWTLITQTPETFKGGTIWSVIKTIHGSVQAIGLALLVLFFVVGVVRTCTNFNEIKRPEQALKLFLRFAIAKGLVTYGLDLMLAIFKICQGVITTIIKSSGLGSVSKTVLPTEIVKAVESCGFFESIPLWAVTLIGGFIFIYCIITSTICNICWRTYAKYRNNIFKILYWSLFRRSNNSIIMYNILVICFIATSSGCFGRSSNSSMEIYRRTNI